MKKFEVIQDNGGGIHLAVLNDEGVCEYFHANYDAMLWKLLEDIEAIRNGDDPAKEWDGNCASCPGILIGACGAEWELGDDPDAIYGEYNFQEGTAHIVVDQDGIYPDRMNDDVKDAFQLWDAFEPVTWAQYDKEASNA